jgi:predicted Zn-dependent protease
VRRRLALAGLVAVLVGAGCASRRLDGGDTFSSPKGYSVRLPGGRWEVDRERHADVALRRPSASTGIVVNAACDEPAARRSLESLARQLLVGVHDRRVLENGEVTVNGRRAAHAVLEARAGDGAAPMRVEMYVIKAGRCVYDFLYAAPPPTFETGRADFQTVVESLRTE